MVGSLRILWSDPCPYRYLQGSFLLDIPCIFGVNAGYHSTAKLYSTLPDRRLKSRALPFKTSL